LLNKLYNSYIEYKRWGDMMNTIKLLLERMGVLQKQFALDIGVSQPTVSDWINNKKDPRGENLKKVANYFSVSPTVIKGIDPLPEELQSRVDDIARVDREIWELREQVRRDPERHYLFSLAKDASIDDVRQAVAVIDALKKTRGGD